MKKTLLLAALGALSVSAHAQFTDDFESYADGPLLSGGWLAWGNSNSEAGTVVSNMARSGSKSVKIDTNGDAGFSDYTDAVHPWTGFSTGKYVVRSWMYLPTGGATGSTPYYILMNLYNGTGGEWSVQMKFSGATGKVTSDMLALTDQVQPDIAYDQWVPIHHYVDLDLVAGGNERGEVREFYNWTRLETAAFQAGFIHTWKAANATPSEIQNIDLFINPEGGSAVQHYYDDVQILPNTHNVNASAVATTEGEEFGGDLDSLSASDDNSYCAFNDAVSLASKILVTTNTDLPSIIAFTFNFELRVERPGVQYAVYFKNYTTNTMQFQAGATAPTTDVSGSVTVSTDAMRYMSGMGEMQAEFRFSPINDEDPSQDGWLHCVDVANYSVTAF